VANHEDEVRQALTSAADAWIALHGMTQRQRQEGQAAAADMSLLQRLTTHYAEVAGLTGDTAGRLVREEAERRLRDRQ